MPRPKVPGAPEPKKRSRTGCWTCKAKKVKCGEEKPKCSNCIKNSEPVCDYSIRLNWEGRTKRKATDSAPDSPEAASASSGGFQMVSFKPPSTTPKHSKSDSAHSFSDAAIGSKRLSPAGTPASASHGHVFSDSSRPSSSHSRTGSTPGSTPTSSTFTQPRMLPPFSSHPSPLTTSSPLEPPTSAPALGEHRDKRPRPNQPSLPQHTIQNSDLLSPHVNNHAYHATSDPYYHSRSIPRSGLSSGDGNTGPDGGAATPSASSVASDDTSFKISATYSEDPRRLSVNSLLVQEEQIKRNEGTSADPNDKIIDYGIDRGLPDLDIPRNDDSRALEVVSPSQTSYTFDGETVESPPEFGFGLFGSNSNDQPGGGYQNPMAVRLSRSLLPLPSLLLDNPMNLMYFHFFQESTARILVPHDCPQNPFKIILPQMAVRDDNLLHLLLAYSASHRARLLKHPEPTNRIALWVSDVFVHLSRALDDTAGRISNSNLATAIMLASLEIIAPNTFGVEVPWQQHLAMARDMIIARGGPRAVNRAKDRVSYFLVRWFAYLDILGNFSSPGVWTGHAMFTGDLYDFEGDNDFQIDCVLGFSGSLASLLAKTADLSRQCDAEHISANGDFDPSWQPSAEVIEQAQNLKERFFAMRYQQYKLCPHRVTNEQDAKAEAMEMSATNEAFMWAGLIHLYRRTMGKSQGSKDVQHAVTEIVMALRRIQKGGAAEACLLFPLFSAGSEALDVQDREVILERLKSVEESGMTQVHKARRLMERVWETGKPWEMLVQGEFFG